MASPIEEVYAAYEEPAKDLNLAAYADNHHALSAWMIVRDLMDAIKAELALRENYTEDSVDFPTPGHIFPFETKHPDPPHLIASECPCKPQRNAEGYWVHRKRNFTRWA